MNPLEKSIRRYISFKVFVISGVFIISLLLSAFAYKTGDKGENMVYAESIKSYKSSVVQILKKKKTRYENYEKKSNTNNRNENGIYIDRIIPVVLQYDGKEQRIMTEKTYVKEVLTDSNLRLDSMDRLEGIKKEDLLYADLRIKITRVRKVHEVSEKTIDFKIKKIDNSDLEIGKSIVKVKGESGSKLIEYDIIYEDGKEKERNQVKELIIKKPVEQVVEIGKKSVEVTSKGVELNYKTVLNMNATGYSCSFIETGKSPGDPGFGITATGTIAKRGTIAVDPNIIPLGSKVYVEGIGTNTDYGYAIAADTGGAIRGNKIDLCFDSRSEAINWGCRSVKVYILK
ncbi:MAG: 3D domain-containing protein [Clostridiales bacterium]